MKAGYARLEITAGLGDIISGLHEPRISDGILDAQYTTAVAFSDGENTVVAITNDILELLKRDTDYLRGMIAEKHGLDPDAILVHSTHTHTGPEVSGIMFTPSAEYVNYLFKRMCDAVGFAIADMKEAKISVGIAEAKGISFIRRFFMEDGTVKTHPRSTDPVVRTQGTPDENVQLIKIEREGAHDIAIVNFQTHPHSIGGTKFSSDFIHFVRLTLEQALCDVAGGKGAKVAYFNGAQGDTCCIDITNPKHDYTLARHTGRTIAGAVLSAYTYAKEVTADKVSFKQTDVNVPATENWGGTDLHITSLRVGDIGFVGFPGEPYTEIGRRVKAGSAYELTITSCNTNGWVSYIPTREAIPYGGLGVNPNANPDIEDITVNTAVALTKELKEIK